MNTRVLPGMLVLIILAASAPQTSAQGPTIFLSSLNLQTDQPAPASSVDEVQEFDLSITERRITRANFEASTAVEIRGDQARGVSLRVGVAVTASNIDVVLRNVSGHVRFRGSLEPVLRRINLRR